jgi:HAD superfamily hydrolase (TIGR01549 family)
MKAESNSKGLVKKYDLFIFDWDGTLNNMRITMRLNEAMKRAFGIWNSDKKVKDFKSVDYNLKGKMRNEELKNDVETFFVELFLNFSRPKLHNDSVELMKKLKSKKKKIAIFSNGRSHRVIREIKILGLTDYFNVIVSARDLHALKPNPTGIKAILSSTKTKPSKCIYIGDMVDDIIAAKLAKVDSCALADGFDSYSRLKSMKPTYIFRSVEEFIKAL